MNTDTLVPLLIFQNMFYYFWMITWMKKVNNFQIAKVQPQGVAQHLVEIAFRQFQPSVAYKSVAYKKKRVLFFPEIIKNYLKKYNNLKSSSMECGYCITQGNTNYV